jgi:pyruvate carboxylase
MPNILFQMLLRGSNGVGYKNYPDNVIRELIRESAEKGIDVFRIFDSLNWVKGMEVAIDEVLKQGKIAEASICYTGDILDTRRDKYTLKYYVDLAKELEHRGAHILAIKDMAALLKPYAAHKLITTLKNEIGIPIHLHTHDTSGNGVATILMAAEAGVDIVDTAFNSMSGLTSQPALNSVVAALKNTQRETGLSSKNTQKLSDYWRDVRQVYYGFESDLKSSSAEIYEFEIPGGQYSNLKPQVESFGLEHRFDEVKQMYKAVNDMFGDIIKVTPSSKAVSDMAIFMVQNDLTPENIYEKGANLSYPDSVVAFFGGMMGQPMGGFPKKLQKLVLKNQAVITIRPGEMLEPHDFETDKAYLEEKTGITMKQEDLISHALYPKVFEEYLSFKNTYGDLTAMGSDIFFHGLYEGETCEVEVDNHRLQIKLITIGKLDENHNRSVMFEINGNQREIRIFDKASSLHQAHTGIVKQFAEEGDLSAVGASIPGKIIKISVEEGQKVSIGQEVAIIEAMKMETIVTSKMEGAVEKLFKKTEDMIESKELIMTIK